MKKIRVALDANMPQRIVALLRAGFGDQGYEFMWEPDFAPPDATDEFWLDAFSRFGGEIILSADKNIAKRPHQMVAFRRAALKGFFFGRPWANLPMNEKAGHVVTWWPAIARRARTCKPGDCFWVPARNKELKEIKMPSEALIKAQSAKPRRRKNT